MNLRDGNFEISVKELYGYIVAELTNVENDIIGYAELDLARLNFSEISANDIIIRRDLTCLLYTSPSPRDQRGSRMPSSA